MQLKSFVNNLTLTQEINDDLIALESQFGDSIANLADRFVDNIGNVRYTLRKLLDSSPNISYVTYPRKEMDRFLDKFQYLDLSNISVYKPVGLKVTYLETLECVTEVQTLVLTMPERVITPFMKWSGEVLTRPELLQRLGSSHPFNFIDALALNTKLDKLFDSNSISDSYPYSSAVKRNNDWPQFAAGINATVDFNNELNAAELKSYVDEVSARIDLIVKRVSEEPERYNLSTPSRKVLSDVVRFMAAEVTLYARVNYVLTSLVKASNDTIHKLLKMR